ncbi:MAG: efflux RND transporter periplasmic adaptor subunit, partial [Terriglobales bacterium]
GMVPRWLRWAAITAALAASAPCQGTLQISPQRLQSIGVQTGLVTYGPVDDTIRTLGNVTVDEEKLASIQARFSGWIETVYAATTYQYVHQGDRLLSIESPEIYAAEQDYLFARRNREALAGSTVAGVAAGAADLLAAALTRLEQQQVPQEEIERLRRTGVAERTITVTSPASGYITERDALPNQHVEPGTRLYTVAGLSPIWVYAAVLESDLGRIRIGDAATVTVAALPGREFAGRVDFIWPELDAATRTAKARIALPNPGATLMPGMYANVQVRVPLGEQITVPAGAVLQAGEQPIAFVDHGGGRLEPRRIVLGSQAGDRIIVLKGLRAGERIVTSANFLIDSESQLQAALGSFAPPPPGVGQAAAPAAAQAQIELTTSPSPPRKGNNLVRVRLTAADGRPLAGAEVTVSFFMPAMPAMGMAAMRTSMHLSDKGGGYYEGTGTLGSGGTWQVTVVAARQGVTLAQQQLSLTATGGMQP